MKLNRNSLLVKLVESTYLEYPETACIFFWASFIALVILPFSFVGHLINYFLKDYVIPALVFVLVWPLCFILGLSVMVLAIGRVATFYMNGWQVTFISTLIGWSFVGLLCLCTYLIANFPDSIDLWLSERYNKIASKISCKPIDWED